MRFRSPACSAKAEAVVQVVDAHSATRHGARRGTVRDSAVRGSTREGLRLGTVRERAVHGTVGLTAVSSEVRFTAARPQQRWEKRQPLLIEKDVSPKRILRRASAEVRYRVHVKNTAPVAVHDVVITDFWPAELTFKSASGASVSGARQGGFDELTLKLEGALNPGEVRTSRSASYQEIKAPGIMAPEQWFIAGDALEVNFTLQFDDV